MKQLQQIHRPRIPAQSIMVKGLMTRRTSIHQALYRRRYSATEADKTTVLAALVYSHYRTFSKQSAKPYGVSCLLARRRD
jgi:hypothetical protein